MSEVDRRVARRVAAAACVAFEIDVDAVFSDKRTASVSHARMAAVAAIYHQRGWSLARIGAAFDRDHSTMSHALKRARELTRAGDWQWTEAIGRATRACNEIPPAPRRQVGWGVPAPLVASS